MPQMETYISISFDRLRKIKLLYKRLKKTSKKKISSKFRKLLVVTAILTSSQIDNIYFFKISKRKILNFYKVYICIISGF